MNEDIREVVRSKYSQAIKGRTGCCGANSGCCDSFSQATQCITGDLYGEGELTGLPGDMAASSFGCGNPTALAELHEGEIVLDLGSGAGLDVLLSARRVGASGKAYGLDMTDEMLAEARANQARAGINNVEFLKGHIEDIPIPDGTVDVIISNCVINLSADKDRVLEEAFRVLKPGGRFAVSDIVLTRPLPEKVQRDIMAWAGCVAGAMLEEEYRCKLAAAGFLDIEVQITRVYDFTGEAAAQMFPEMSEAELNEINGAVASAFIRSKKPSRLLEEGKDYRIRIASGDDFPAINELLGQCGLPVAGVREKIQNFLLADAGEGGVTGVIGVEQQGGSVLLRSLAVRPEWRKSGIGSELVEKAMKRARQAGGRHFYLLTNTAENYMRKWGFEKIERGQIPPGLLHDSGLDTACPSCGICMGFEDGE